MGKLVHPRVWAFVMTIFWNETNSDQGRCRCWSLQSQGISHMAPGSWIPHLLGRIDCPRHTAAVDIRRSSSPTYICLVVLDSASTDCGSNSTSSSPQDDHSGI
ncbi:hypothetical protein LshimejAT787_0209270 [Lyophyllum shimeji]|uniref:Uncharacterized protein n=1 Tax=Lyophyllum shimeji TaxID=47721 RepID=A0A9P3PG16_LYOSH|nr:hypothetical protein LshimejAT787_0209270 [Lyophyllum shimeji]